ncbi:MAG TPA: UDP-glucuronic acid decarboxylase family protein [Candidatus Nanopelagicaceae bacterium]|nr:UDP-glucuronic acid decarboxylase family protein [Candidatus Nanopelagicaceae bacterium]
MRVVVTGGAGFLGSHICEYLAARGDEVVCVDDFSTGARSNLGSLLASAQFTLIEADISKRLPVEGRVDAVMNMASAASPVDYLARPLQTLEVGSTGTKRCLELAAQHSARFLQASTSEVYGDPSRHPQVEDYWGNVNPIGPRSVYDEAKRFSEALSMAWRRLGLVNVGIARIFNTYGPRLRPGDGRVVSNFICQALQGQELTVYGDGEQTRSLCYVEDEVRGLVALLDSDLPGPVNVGNPDEYTINQLAHKVVALCQSDSAIVHRPLPADDPTRRCPDISLARSQLHWEPKVTLDDGLQRTAAWMRVRLGLAQTAVE